MGKLYLYTSLKYRSFLSRWCTEGSIYPLWEVQRNRICHSQK